MLAGQLQTVGELPYSSFGLFQVARPQRQPHCRKGQSCVPVVRICREKELAAPAVAGETAIAVE
jgi:hypothetical protein